MNATQVLLSVTGVAQNVGAEDDAVHLVTHGTLSGENDAWHLTYDETEPDDDETRHVTLTMKKGVVSMLRQGSNATSMVFQRGRRFEGCYHTPYGDLDMGVFATSVRYAVEDASGEIALKYQLDLQGKFAAMHELHIRFVPSKRR